MEYLAIAKLVWEFAKKAGGKLFQFFMTPLGKVVLVLALGWGYGQYQHHAGVSETNATWQAKWDKHIKADKDAADQRKQDAERADRANKALFQTQSDIIKDLQKKLAAEKERKDRIHTIIKEVPKYVTPKADAAAVVPAGFVWVFNESAKGFPFDSPGLPSSPPSDVDAPSGVALSTVAGVIAYNHDECTTRGELLDHWQEWYVKNKAAWEAYVKAATPPH